MPIASAALGALDDLWFECPQCRSRYSDDLEMLTPAAMQQIICEGCRARLWVLLLDCAHCAEETVFVWSTPPNTATLAHLFCMKCGYCLGAKDRT